MFDCLVYIRQGSQLVIVCTVFQSNNCQSLLLKLKPKQRRCEESKQIYPTDVLLKVIRLLIIEGLTSFTLGVCRFLHLTYKFKPCKVCFKPSKPLVPVFRKQHVLLQHKQHVLPTGYALITSAKHGKQHFVGVQTPTKQWFVLCRVLQKKGNV